MAQSIGLLAVLLVQVFLIVPKTSEAVPRYARQNRTYNVIPPTSFGIFHSLWEIFNILQNIPEIMNIPQVYDLYEKMKRNRVIQMPRADRKPFIVIEGVKGSGKTTTAVILAEKLKGIYLRAPPDYFAPFKLWIRTRNKLERNAFHSLSNYLLAEQVKIILDTQPVVMDLYWHGLTAYELGRLAGNNNVLPLPSSAIYKWPEDLLVPDVAFYVMVNDEARYYKEKETNKPAINKHLRETMFRAYSRFLKPRMIKISGDRSRREVESEIRNITFSLLQGMI